MIRSRPWWRWAYWCFMGMAGLPDQHQVSLADFLYLISVSLLPVGSDCVNLRICSSPNNASNLMCIWKGTIRLGLVARPRALYAYLIQVPNAKCRDCFFMDFWHQDVIMNHHYQSANAIVFLENSDWKVSENLLWKQSVKWVIKLPWFYAVLWLVFTWYPYPWSPVEITPVLTTFFVDITPVCTTFMFRDLLWHHNGSWRC